MHYKTNRQNHDFQIAYFIAGACQTPDAAYAILCDLQEDRQNALKVFLASEKREAAKVVRAKMRIDVGDDADRLEGEADLLEIEAFADTVKRNVAGATAELACIEKCMQALEPLRKYKHLPLAEAHEAAQSEEWLLQLKATAQNQMITQGTIAADHFATMRMHPCFQQELVPFIDNMRQKLLEAKGNLSKVLPLLTKPTFDLPKLIGAE